MKKMRVIGKEVNRKDGRSKTDGSLKYMADIQLEGMLYGQLVHPPIPHARILSIDTSAAEQVPGVMRVVTAADVPGVNKYGLLLKDQPVLCDERVRFLGDSVAAVIAVSKEIAAAAAELVEVEYEPLPHYMTPKESMAPGAVVIHDSCPGNILHHIEHVSGDVEKAFAAAAAVVENVYTTPYEAHSYLECEGGIACPTEDGGVEVWAPSQWGMRARRDLSEILDMPEEKIRVHSNPIGGGFGGKDDLILQGVLCVSALVCNRPVHISFSREESYLVGPKRVPYEFKLKTAVDSEGNLIAHQARVIGTSGAYCSYTSAVLLFTMENVCGPYRVKNIDITGDMVLTNNTFCSAFRGFGNNQSNFAMESQMDILAEKIGMDPMELRKRNAIKYGERSTFGQKTSEAQYVLKTLEVAEKSDLWKNREAWKKKAPHPWIKRGVGVATCQHGNSIGYAIPVDGSRVRVELHTNGRLTVYTGNEDMGQGCITTLCMIAAEAMCMPYEHVDLVCGDSLYTPDSGPNTASRVTFITGNALMAAVKKLREAIGRMLNVPEDKLESDAIGFNGYSMDQIAAMLEPEDRVQTAGAVVRNTDIRISFSLHYLTTQLTQVAAVEVNTLTGQTKVVEMLTVPAAGKIINKLGFEGQCDGGVAMSTGYALHENYRGDAIGAPITKNFQTYLIPTISDMPKTSILPIEDPETEGPYGARGIGEPAAVPGASAIANAVGDAIGIRFNDLPCDQEKVLLALSDLQHA